MTQPAFKPILIDLLRQAQSRQNAFMRELPPAARAAIGTPALWAPKDHVAHLTFWRLRLVRMVQAHLQQTPQPRSEDFEQLNPIIFEEQRYRSWSEISAESDQAYADLIALTNQLTEEDLTAFNRFDWVHGGMPLYTAFMGNCYEHTQNHLAQYAGEHDDLERERATYVEWANRVLEAEVPQTLKGYVLYNLACFYATHGQVEKAAEPLRQAFVFFPQSREYALTDLDLVQLRPNLPE
ncbi:MAG TPA: ClbS/DfsB family four-helix bundle protein [Ktedonobacterales bacterium]|nr:ClbS/DfsB family four-helix bundle protein [Ktedonobacterales bacterium]